ncbi:MAG: hypothetical protein WAV92_13135 [Halopseudomonas yangmingensis]|uniref:DNA polymerase III subunit chi n=1 Tax=Halopseudomonas yangmingensis TaxID=1720063 RepID=A0A1I4RCT6_9GAMM|nr:hypothetical protein [Halopseudomonas yangmingensis]SFM50029.1 hypothetical protein SAMN05216217_106137 [Halopseudomonas yangmingensis]
MDSQDPENPSQLLEDLESIRSLLDEAEGKAIPLLRDVIADEQLPSPDPRITTEEARNPFLPYASLARLAEERHQLEQLLGPIAPPPPSRNEPVPVEEPVKLRSGVIRRRLRDEAELVLQEVIDELMPSLEAALRQRLKTRLDQLIDQQIDQQRD